ncbi:uncharacterized protein [Physcomitrium patens]|uniref:Small ribosomal subunit protein bS18c n=1 Tax=Physcomitrium patens TaxID=3218 RepID=A0A2K1K1L0_PHYPA|nr:uncharacterized protein LOC112286509 [Physcomitrium patens]PNR47660.1 hypothetical protein PHYPA_012133 [Physcomitrium patens]|eukprot:XP_024384213.1 uncharacterized protein LOC112286509 [Physcomitrella patens]
MSLAKMGSLRGALLGRIAAARISQALSHGSDLSATSGQYAVLWRFRNFASSAQDGDGGSNGGGNPEDKGQWRNWVEQRLKAKGEGQSASRDDLHSPSEISVGGTSANGAFGGSQNLAADPHPVDLPMDDFELRVLGISPKKDDGEDDDLLRELEELERSASWRAAGPTNGMEGGLEAGDDEEDDDDEEWEDERGQVLSDAALSAIVDYDLDDEQRPYQFRPNRLFFPGQTYDPEDLDLSKKPEELEKPPPRYKRRYDNNEVLQRADFRNPRYLSNFISETSRILPKRRSSLTAKAQRKVIREIKTARAFGLMPFTSMGRPPFRFLRSRLDDEDTNN